MKKEVIRHLKSDIKNFKKEASEDKSLIKKLKSKHAKHEKSESKAHEKKEHSKKKHVKKIKSVKKVSTKSRKETPKFRAKVKKVMDEFKAGMLHSGSKKGPKVKSRKQAIAISLSEARKAVK